MVQVEDRLVPSHLLPPQIRESLLLPELSLHSEDGGPLGVTEIELALGSYIIRLDGDVVVSGNVVGVVAFRDRVLALR